mmetsp:Transcript_3148/g.5171  ORF Transcript_3148/g.5171 Transcript_3148/m.5171 type:complete len:225 (-) Transcript_3148:439-1113(-)
MNSIFFHTNYHPGPLLNINQYLTDDASAMHRLLLIRPHFYLSPPCPPLSLFIFMTIVHLLLHLLCLIYLIVDTYRSAAEIQFASPRPYRPNIISHARRVIRVTETTHQDLISILAIIVFIIIMVIISSSSFPIVITIIIIRISSCKIHFALERGTAAEQHAPNACNFWVAGRDRLLACRFEGLGPSSTKFLFDHQDFLIIRISIFFFDFVFFFETKVTTQVIPL